MIKKITGNPDLQLFLALCILFLIKNTYFFFDSHAGSGTWGINNSLNWVWETIRTVSMPALGSLSLCGALLFAIRGQKKQALYFVAVFLILFPFHQLLVNQFYTYDGFFVLRPKGSLADHIFTTIRTYSYFMLLVFFLAGMLLAHILNKRATIFYKILLGLTIVSITGYLVFDACDPDHFALYIHAIFYGGIAAWMFAVLNYLGYTGAQVLRHILFYFSVVMSIAGSYCIWRLLPNGSDSTVQFPFLLSVIGSIILVLLYHLSPRNVITVIAPFIPLLGAAVTIINYEVSFTSVNNSSMIMSAVMHWSNGNIWWAALTCLTPALLVPFFRQFPVTVIETGN